MTEEQLNGFFEKPGIKAVINHYNAIGRTIYYATIGEDHLPAILLYMVHRHP